jgi:hypothetical protein
METPLEKLLETAMALPAEDRRRLLDLLMLSSPTAQPRKTVDQLATERGKKPLNFKEIRDLGSFFPEDENIDDLVQTVRELRRDRSPRSLA